MSSSAGELFVFLARFGRFGPFSTGMYVTVKSRIGGRT
jgi:hypothetical protein